MKYVKLVIAALLVLTITNKPIAREKPTLNIVLTPADRWCKSIGCAGAVGSTCAGGDSISGQKCNTIRHKRKQ